MGIDAGGHAHVNFGGTVELIPVEHLSISTKGMGLFDPSEVKTDHGDADTPGLRIKGSKWTSSNTPPAMAKAVAPTLAPAYAHYPLLLNKPNPEATRNWQEFDADRPTGGGHGGTPKEKAAGQAWGHAWGKGSKEGFLSKKAAKKAAKAAAKQGGQGISKSASTGAKKVYTPEETAAYNAKRAAAEAENKARDTAYAADRAKYAGDYATRDLHAEGAWEPKTHASRYGTIMFNGKGHVLMREPTNHFDGIHWTPFAKGHQERDQHPSMVAMRETEEEMGYTPKLVGHVPGGFKSPEGYPGTKSVNHYYLAEDAGRPFNPDAMNGETQTLAWATPQQADEMMAQGKNVAAVHRDRTALRTAVSAYEQARPQVSPSEPLKDLEPLPPPPPPKPPKPTSGYGSAPDTPKGGYKGMWYPGMPIQGQRIETSVWEVRNWQEWDQERPYSGASWGHQSPADRAKESALAKAATEKTMAEHKAEKEGLKPVWAAGHNIPTDVAKKAHADALNGPPKESTKEFSPAEKAERAALADRFAKEAKAIHSYTPAGTRAQRFEKGYTNARMDARDKGLKDYQAHTLKLAHEHVSTYKENGEDQLPNLKQAEQWGAAAGYKAHAIGWGDAKDWHGGGETQHVVSPASPQPVLMQKSVTAVPSPEHQQAAQDAVKAAKATEEPPKAPTTYPHPIKVEDIKAGDKITGGPKGMGYKGEVTVHHVTKVGGTPSFPEHGYQITLKGLENSSKTPLPHHEGTEFIKTGEAKEGEEKVPDLVKAKDLQAGDKFKSGGGEHTVTSVESHPAGFTVVHSTSGGNEHTHSVQPDFEMPVHEHGAEPETHEPDILEKLQSALGHKEEPAPKVEEPKGTNLEDAKVSASIAKPVVAPVGHIGDSVPKTENDLLHMTPKKTGEKFSNGETVPGVGSGGGQWHEANDGKAYFVKAAKSDEHAMNDVAGALAYEQAGHNVPKTTLLTMNNGSLRAVSHYIPGLTPIGPKNATEDLQADARKASGMDALMSHYDITGMPSSHSPTGIDGHNLFHDENGKVVRLDLGGTGKFRAMGGIKSSWTPHAWNDAEHAKNDYETIRNGAQGTIAYGQTPHGVDKMPEDMKASLANAANFDTDKYHQSMLQAGISHKFADEQAAVIKARQAHLKLSVLSEAQKTEGENPLVKVEDLHPGDKIKLGSEVHTVSHIEPSTYGSMKVVHTTSGSGEHISTMHPDFELEHLGYGETPKTVQNSVSTLPKPTVEAPKVLPSTAGGGKEPEGESLAHAHLEFHEGTSNKFYESSVVHQPNGMYTHVTKYGSTLPGSHVKTNTNNHYFAKDALLAHESILSQKVGKGYQALTPQEAHAPEVTTPPVDEAAEYNKGHDLGVDTAYKMMAVGHTPDAVHAEAEKLGNPHPTHPHGVGFLGGMHAAADAEEAAANEEENENFDDHESEESAPVHLDTPMHEVPNHTEINGHKVYNNPTFGHKYGESKMVTIGSSKGHGSNYHFPHESLGSVLAKHDEVMEQAHPSNPITIEPTSTAHVPEGIPAEIAQGHEHAYTEGKGAGYQHGKTMLEEGGKEPKHLKFLSSNNYYKQAKAAKGSGNDELHAYNYGFAHGLNQAANEKSKEIKLAKKGITPSVSAPKEASVAPSVSAPEALGEAPGPLQWEKMPEPSVIPKPEFDNATDSALYDEGKAKSHSLVNLQSINDLAKNNFEKMSSLGHGNSPWKAIFHTANGKDDQGPKMLGSVHAMYELAGYTPVEGEKTAASVKKGTSLDSGAKVTSAKKISDTVKEVTIESPEGKSTQEFPSNFPTKFMVPEHLNAVANANHAKAVARKAKAEAKAAEEAAQAKVHGLAVDGVKATTHINLAEHAASPDYAEWYGHASGQDANKTSTDIAKELKLHQELHGMSHGIASDQYAGAVAAHVDALNANKENEPKVPTASTGEPAGTTWHYKHSDTTYVKNADGSITSHGNGQEITTVTGQDALTYEKTLNSQPDQFAKTGPGEATTKPDVNVFGTTLTHEEGQKVLADMKAEVYGKGVAKFLAQNGMSKYVPYTDEWDKATNDSISAGGTADSTKVWADELEKQLGGGTGAGEAQKVAPTAASTKGKKTFTSVMPKSLKKGDQILIDGKPHLVTYKYGQKIKLKEPGHPEDTQNIGMLGDKVTKLAPGHAAYKAAEDFDKALGYTDTVTGTGDSTGFVSTPAEPSLAPGSKAGAKPGFMPKGVGVAHAVIQPSQAGDTSSNGDLFHKNPGFFNDDYNKAYEEAKSGEVKDVEDIKALAQKAHDAKAGTKAYAVAKGEWDGSKQAHMDWTEAHKSDAQKQLDKDYIKKVSDVYGSNGKAQFAVNKTKSKDVPTTIPHGAKPTHATTESSAAYDQGITQGYDQAIMAAKADGATPEQINATVADYLSMSHAMGTPTYQAEIMEQAHLAGLAQGAGKAAVDLKHAQGMHPNASSKSVISAEKASHEAGVGAYDSYSALSTGNHYLNNQSNDQLHLSSEEKEAVGDWKPHGFRFGNPNAPIVKAMDTLAKGHDPGNGQHAQNAKLLLKMWSEKATPNAQESIRKIQLSPGTDLYNYYTAVGTTIESPMASWTTDPTRWHGNVWIHAPVGTISFDIGKIKGYGGEVETLVSGEFKIDHVKKEGNTTHVYVTQTSAYAK